MIVDRLENANRYKGISEMLDKALAIAAGEDWSAKECGRYEIEPDRLFYVVEQYTTKDIETARPEAHRKFTDVQIVIKGRETIGHCDTAGLAVETEYSQEKDIEFFAAPESQSRVLMEAGMFAVFFAGEGHSPCCDADSKSDVKKAVIKVSL